MRILSSLLVLLFVVGTATAEEATLDGAGHYQKGIEMMDSVGDLAAAITFWTLLSIPAAILALISALSSVRTIVNTTATTNINHVGIYEHLLVIRVEEEKGGEKQNANDEKGEQDVGEFPAEEFGAKVLDLKERDEDRFEY